MHRERKWHEMGLMVSPYSIVYRIIHPLQVRQFKCAPVYEMGKASGIAMVGYPAWMVTYNVWADVVDCRLWRGWVTIKKPLIQHIRSRMRIFAGKLFGRGAHVGYY